MTMEVELEVAILSPLLGSLSRDLKSSAVDLSKMVAVATGKGRFLASELAS